MFGLDDIAGSSEIVIVEGEMDKLALEQAGIKNVVSVPDGAPGKVRDGDLPAPEEDRKFEYLWNCRAALDPVSRIVIAVDSDGPGQALAEELARRLGKERCYRVTWPEGCKDANDVLQKEGDAAVRGSIDNAEGFPLRGLFRFSDFQDDISNYFGVSEASEMKGVSTGGEHRRALPTRPRRKPPSSPACPTAASPSGSTRSCATSRCSTGGRSRCARWRTRCTSTRASSSRSTPASRGSRASTGVKRHGCGRRRCARGCTGSTTSSC